LSLLAEQLLNGMQLGVMLFLMAAGLTLVFGILGLINLAHGSLYMAGAYAAALAAAYLPWFGLAVLCGVVAAALLGIAIEASVIRALYRRPHLDQVLATFGLIMIVNESAALLFGRQPLRVALPDALGGAVRLFGVPYPAYRLVIIAAGLAVALGLWGLINRSRIGALVRASASDREIVAAMGVPVRLLSAAIFALGAGLAGLAGALIGPIASVEIGMGERILITTFVVIVIGGIGSIRGAFAGAMLVGLVDTMARAYLPELLRVVLAGSEADALAGGLSSMMVFVLMAVVLLARPKGLFPAHA
jgi:branched-chain amino acid transport system permease protein